MNQPNDTPIISTDELIYRLFAIRTELHRVKELYPEQDLIVLELRNRGVVTMADPNATDVSVFEIRDNFATANTVFRPAGVKRFELCEVREPKAKRKAG